MGRVIDIPNEARPTQLGRLTIADLGARLWFFEDGYGWVGDRIKSIEMEADSRGGSFVTIRFWDFHGPLVCRDPSAECWVLRDAHPAPRPDTRAPVYNAAFDAVTRKDTLCLPAA